MLGALVLASALLGGAVLSAVADGLDDGGSGSTSYALPAPSAGDGAGADQTATSRDAAEPSSASASTEEFSGGGAAADSSSAGSPPLASAPSSGAASVDPSVRSSTVSPDDSRDGPARPAGAQPRIVRNGTVALTVPAGGVDKAVQTLSDTVTGLAGYVESSEVSGTASTTDETRQHANIALRVPSASFEQLRTGLGEVGTVTSSTTTSRDVTGEYVDLEARKRALETTRGAYLTLLAKATTVGEALSVQQAIGGVQTQIEQIEGQRQVLADASDLATLTVRITEPGAPDRFEPADEPSGIETAARRSWDRFVNGIEEIIALIGPLALLGLIAGAAYLVLRLVRRVRRARVAPRPAERVPAVATTPAVPGAPSSHPGTTPTGPIGPSAANQPQELNAEPERGPGEKDPAP